MAEHVVLNRLESLRKSYSMRCFSVGFAAMMMLALAVLGAVSSEGAIDDSSLRQIAETLIREGMAALETYMRIMQERGKL